METSEVFIGPWERGRPARIMKTLDKNRHMKSLTEIKRIIRMHKPMLIEKHKISEIGIFGSYVRGEGNQNSDIDILVNFEEYPGLIEFVGMEDELSQYLGTKVDLMTKSGLKPAAGQHILKEVVYL